MCIRLGKDTALIVSKGSRKPLSLSTAFVYQSPGFRRTEGTLGLAKSGLLVTIVKKQGMLLATMAWEVIRGGGSYLSH
jgi:hypothetical protein